MTTGKRDRPLSAAEIQNVASEHTPDGTALRARMPRVSRKLNDN